MSKPTIDVNKPADEEIIGEGAERITASTRFLWEPVSQESTEWEEVDYPK